MNDPQPDPKKHADTPGAEVNKRGPSSEWELSVEINRRVKEKLKDIPASLQDDLAKLIAEEVASLSSALENSLAVSTDRILRGAEDRSFQLMDHHIQQGTFDEFLREFSDRSSMLRAVYDGITLGLKQPDSYQALFVSDCWEKKLSQADGSYQDPDVMQLSWYGFLGRKNRDGFNVNALEEGLKASLGQLGPYLRSRNIIEIAATDLFRKQYPSVATQQCFAGEHFTMVPCFHGDQQIGAFFISIPGMRRLTAQSKKTLKLLSRDLGAGLAHIKRMREAEGGSFGT